MKESFNEKVHQLPKDDLLVSIRELRLNEINILEDLLYESIFQVDLNNPIPREVLKEPRVNAYIVQYGKQKGDHCLVADLNGEIIGAVWVRILAGKYKGYGNVDNQTPEFVISLYPEYRNKGLGTRLMKEMIALMKTKGYPQVSLSVQKENYAVNLYKKLGFEISDENDEDFIMLLKLNGYESD